jgi:hypothetical protein
MIAGMVVLAACGTSAGGGAVGRASDSASVRPPSTTPPPDASTSPRESATQSSPPAGHCAAGRTTVSVAPGAAVQQRLCVRPGTTVSLVLRPRADDKRWTAVRSSAPVFVQVSGWRLDADGTAHASLRCAGTRAGTAEITALAKAPDVAGAARGAFTLHVSVVPWTTQP